jgi:hypothetical protein
MVTSVLWIALMGAAISLIVYYRDGATHTDVVTLRIKENLGHKDPSKDSESYLAWFSVTSPPIVLTTTCDEIAENLLVFEEYPLFPVRFCGIWLAPGQTVSTLIVRDEDGNPLSIRVLP